MRRLLLLACVLAAAPNASAATTASESLRVTVDKERFALEFRDVRDGDAFRTVAARAAPDDPRAAYGPLGFSFDLRQPVVNNAYLGYYAAAEVNTVWFHATRVLSARKAGGALLVEAATNDPLGHRIALELRPDRGALELEARIVGALAGHERAWTIAFDSAP